MLRVGGGYSNKCSNCEFSTKELQKCKEQLEGGRKRIEDQENRIEDQENRIEDQEKRICELEEKIMIMIEERALEEMNVMNKLDQVMNLVKSV